jgi:hypothetical protein
MKRALLRAEVRWRRPSRALKAMRIGINLDDLSFFVVLVEQIIQDIPQLRALLFLGG